MKLKNITIRTQLFIGFSILLIFIILLGLMSGWQNNILQSETETLYNHPLKVRREISNLRLDFFSIRHDLNDLFIKPEEKEIVDINNIEKYKADALDQITQLNNQYMGPHANVDSLKCAILLWDATIDETIRLLLAGRTEKAEMLIQNNALVEKEESKVIANLQKIDDFSQLSKINFTTHNYL